MNRETKKYFIETMLNLIQQGFLDDAIKEVLGDVKK